MATGLAKELFEAQENYVRLFWKVFNIIDDEICPPTPEVPNRFAELRFDSYDETVDFYGQHPNFNLTAKQKQKILALGFAGIWSDHTRGTDPTRECKACMELSALNRPT